MSHLVRSFAFKMFDFYGDGGPLADGPLFSDQDREIWSGEMINFGVAFDINRLKNWHLFSQCPR